MSKQRKWRDTIFENLVLLQRGIDLPQSQRRVGDIPILGSSGVTGYHNESKVAGPGITVGRSGASIGVVTYSDIDFWPLNTALYVKDFRGNHPRFAYYFLKQFDFKRYNSGSAQPSLNRNFVHPTKIRIPPLKTQQAIAHILGTIDEKIDLNRRMNETLEAMAQAIFKSWFVDFDPVKAKARGEQPVGMDAETAALFPDSFEPSGLGEIPRGWRVSEVGKEVIVKGGATPSTKNPLFWDGGSFCWATPKDLSALESPVLLDTARKITEEGVNRISSKLLPKGTLLMSSRAPVGYLAIAEIDTAVNQGFIAMECSKSLNCMYMLFWCKENMETIKSNANGSTFQEISKKNFKPISIIVPEELVLNKFESAISPLYRKIVSNLKERQTLTSLRDTLLPNLISGELSVAEVERKLEAEL
ncbi:restriction endonuclease subunit S [Maridesulfovibrio salexigens]|uniref:Restriction modification system DNA specificity domain protein n=1 Tax=Maridesulfovibrio salexigens (strain ATCC 14822 / DSM 2638 / NCIMB 8403 / VKM B-1763) TaxID=526222 RepID=C6BZF1_MARSD|nr:restriction endonuclease subunit S [Maridesulfovibrio salexigens]ACS80788.1 restriction modification system DNA specificity domain protein [Maridesulfovibrio salexigens DSM 2638]